MQQVDMTLNPDVLVCTVRTMHLNIQVVLPNTAPSHAYVRAARPFAVPPQPAGALVVAEFQTRLARGAAITDAARAFA
jgi:hypothetical protein